MSNRLAFISIILSIGALCLLAASGSTQAEPEPQELLDIAVEQLQTAQSFRLAIEQSGATYPLSLSFDGVNTLPATLQSAEAQYVQPNELHISALVNLLLPLWLDIYSRDDRQWVSFPRGAPWFLLPAFEDFDVNRLLAPDDGIEYVMTNLQEPQIIDAEAQLDDETVWHLQAQAAGDSVSSLLFGFIEPEADVALDIYITVADGRFALLEMTMLETVDDESEEEPSLWLISFYDYDAPRGFDPPS